MLLASSLASAQSVTFARRAPVFGDVLDQTVVVAMKLQQTGRQGAEVLEESETQQDRRQQRRVTATEVVAGRVVAARVDFFESRTETNGEAEADPIRGKSYLCRREGEKLLITTLDAQTPPIKEYALVARAMATLGEASPLADFLAGRTVAVGDRLDVPPEVAQRAFGLDKSLGEVERFTLTLRAVEGPLARFDAEIEATGLEGQQMRLVAGGDLRIDAATCRMASANLAGPVAMSATVGQYTIDARGKLRMALASQSHDAAR